MMGSLLLQTILIIAGSSLGACQVILTRSSSNITCENELVEYTCTVQSVQVQWVVEPFINSSGISLFIASNRAETLNTLLRDGIVQIRHVSMNPFTTVLSINSSLIDQFTDFECIAFPDIDISSTLRFNVSKERFVSEASSFVFKRMVNESIVMLSWAESPSLDIVRYVIINCTVDGDCGNVTVNSSSPLNATIPVMRGTIYNFDLLAENRCGFRSTPISVVNFELTDSIIVIISANSTNCTVIKEVDGFRSTPVSAVTFELTDSRILINCTVIEVIEVASSDFRSATIGLGIVGGLSILITVTMVTVTIVVTLLLMKEMKKSKVNERGAIRTEVNAQDITPLTNIPPAQDPYYVPPK